MYLPDFWKPVKVGVLTVLNPLMLTIVGVFWVFAKLKWYCIVISEWYIVLQYTADIITLSVQYTELSRFMVKVDGGGDIIYYRMIWLIYRTCYFHVLKWGPNYDNIYMNNFVIAKCSWDIKCYYSNTVWKYIAENRLLPSYNKYKLIVHKISHSGNYSCHFSSE